MTRPDPKAMKQYMKARAWFSANRGTVIAESPLKKRCRHVWVYGLWTSCYLCEKCGGYDTTGQRYKTGSFG